MKTVVRPSQFDNPGNEFQFKHRHNKELPLEGAEREKSVGVNSIRKSNILDLSF